MASNADRPQIRGLIRVLPYVYLGNATAAQNKEELQRLKITHVMNCVSDHGYENEHTDAFEYINLEDLEDDHECDISEVFEPTFEALKNIKEEKTRILVHCDSGKSISPTIVLQYMMKASKAGDKYLPLKKALAYMKSMEPGINPRDNFLKALIEVEIELYEEASMRVSSGGGSSRGYKGKGRGRKGKRGK